MNIAKDRWGALFQWVESLMGGKIVWRERQARGRPAWYFDVETDGETISLYWRGYRGSTGKSTIYDDYPIEREAKLLQVLEEYQIPVPHVYGFCPDPKGILMERSPGDPNFHHIANEDDKEAVARHFMETLAKTHNIPVNAFEAIGMIPPTSPGELALNDLTLWENHYRGLVTEPAPFIEFTIKWLRQNVPKREVRPVLVQADTGPGQFLFENGRVTAVIDWEFAHLGDPMYDLAQIRGRDLSYPFGDLKERFRLYSELSGNPVDLETLHYYCVRGIFMTPMGVESLVQKPPAMMDVPQTLAWYVVYYRATVECLAEAIGIELGQVHIPEPVHTPRSKIFDVVMEQLQNEHLSQIGDSYNAYRMQTTIQLVDHLRLAEKLGPAIDSLELDDMETILGSRPDSIAAGNAALEKLVLESGPERDAEFIRYFYRHIVREETMLKPAMGELATLGKLSPID